VHHSATEQTGVLWRGATLNSMQQSTLASLALWRNGSDAVSQAGDSGSNPSLCHIFWFIFS